MNAGVTRAVTRGVSHAVTRPESGFGVAPGMPAILVAGAADWFAGTHAGTHHEAWAGNTSRDTLTMGYAPKMPLGFGSHVWFGGPKAFQDAERGVTIFSVTSVSTDLRLGLVEVNHVTAARKEVTVASFTALAPDNHYYLAIYKRADGRYVVMMAFHDYDQTIRWWISTNPNDITSWGAVKTKSFSTPGGPAYPVLYRLDGDGGRVVVIVRSGSAYGGDNCQYYMVSTDDMETLGSPTKFVSKQAGSAHGVYLQAYPDPGHSNRIWFIASDYFVNTYPSHQLDDLVMFYGEWSAGAATFFSPNGTSLGADVAWAESTAGNLGLVYDSGVTGYSAWPLDLVVKDSVAYGVFVEEQNPNLGTVYNYKIAVIDFTGTPTLNVRTLWSSATDGSNGTLATATQAYPYPCGAVLCRWNPARAWVSFGTGASTTTNRAKIRLVTTADNWVTRTVTIPGFTQGRCHNFHPVVPFVSDFSSQPPAFCEMAYETGYLNSWDAVHAMIVTPDWNGAVHAFDMNEASGTPVNKLFLAGVLGSPAKKGSPVLGMTGINNGKAVSVTAGPDAIEHGYAAQLTRPVVAAWLGWFNLDNVSAIHLSGVSDGSSGRKFYGINGANLSFLGVGSSSSGAGASGISAGTWHHWGVLVGLSGGNPQLAMHVDGALKNTFSAGFSEAGLKHWTGAVNNGGTGSSPMSGDFCQIVEDWGEGRDAAWLLAVKGHASGGTFASARKVAVVTGGTVTGVTVTPTASLPAGTSYTLKLTNHTKGTSQTQTGTAAAPVVFNAISVENGDELSVEVAASTSNKTVAPSFTSFSLAA